jgi:hypothetical protein
MSWESQEMALLTASLVRPFGLAVAARLILRVLGVRHPASRACGLDGGAHRDDDAAGCELDRAALECAGAGACPQI